eukprot:17985-Heterococcus_DN1.PRE.2
MMLLVSTNGAPCIVCYYYKLEIPVNNAHHIDIIICLQVVLNWLLSCECKPRVLQYMLLNDTTDVAVDDALCTLLLLLVVFAVIWSAMFTTTTVLYHVIQTPPALTTLMTANKHCYYAS